MIRRFTDREIPRKRIDVLSSTYSQPQIKYICSILDEEELLEADKNQESNSKDHLYEAVAKDIAENKPWIFSILEARLPKDLHHYLQAEIKWIESKKSALEKALHHELTNPELAREFNALHQGQKFKVFYALKYPDQMEKQKQSF